MQVVLCRGGTGADRAHVRWVTLVQVGHWCRWGHRYRWLWWSTDVHGALVHRWGCIDGALVQGRARQASSIIVVFYAAIIKCEYNNYSAKAIGL